MRNIFLIAAEHHLIQVERAIDHFNIDPNTAVFWFIKLSTKDNWVEKYIAQQPPDLKYRISHSWTFTDLLRFDKRPKALIKQLKVSTVDPQVERLFYSQYESDFSLLALALLDPQEVILMDEGTASFSVCQKRKATIKANRIKLLIKSFFYQKKIDYPSSLLYFTQYALDIPVFDRIEKYEFPKMDNTLLQMLDDQVYFLGSSMSEVGLVDESYYLDCMKKIYDRYKDKTKVTYFRHRKESLSKLEKIQNMGFVIKANDTPFEFYFETLEVSAATLGSFFSPTLQTISLKYINLPKLDVFKVDSSKLKFNHKVVKEIYHAYSTNQDINTVCL